jgi:hypothetical protein
MPPMRPGRGGNVVTSRLATPKVRIQPDPDSWMAPYVFLRRPPRRLPFSDDGARRVSVADAGQSVAANGSQSSGSGSRRGAELPTVTIERVVSDSSVAIIASRTW